MGGSSSVFDYEAQLLEYGSQLQSTELSGAEWEEKGYGLPRTNNMAHQHGMTTVVNHLTDPSKISRTIWECFLTGREYNPAAAFLCTRAYQVDPNYTPPPEEDIKESKEETKTEATPVPTNETAEKPVEPDSVDVKIDESGDAAAGAAGSEEKTAPASNAETAAPASAEEKPASSEEKATPSEEKTAPSEEKAASSEEKAAPVEADKKKKKKEPSGYVEREDGSIKRFDYVIDTYDEIYESATALGRGFVKLGGRSGQTVGIFAVNRAEWIVAALAVYSQNMRIVPLYATLGPNAVEYILGHAEIRTMVVSRENIGAIKKIAPKVSNMLRRIIVIDAIHNGRYGNTLDRVSQADVQFFRNYNIEVVSLNKLIVDNLGNADEVPVVPPKPEDAAFIMYTSGTTGVPKGVLVTHQNVIAVAGSIKYLVRLEPHDTYFSYLPLAHIFETAAQCVFWSIGGKIFFSQGDIRQLVDDLRLSRPMIMCGVPRVFSRFYSNITLTVEKSNFLKRWYFNRALNGQAQLLRRGYPLDPTYDSRVFATIRDTIGLTNIKTIVSGAAPCPPYLIEFMRALLGPKAIFLQGYGMTECCAGSCVTLPTDTKCGNVGPPLACNIIKLADIPEMKYTSADPHPRGEVLMHGPNVFGGYFKNEEATNDTFHIDPQGRRWLCTGDVGRWNPDGTLSIIDRKKNIVKLQQGEYVAVEMVEDTYGRANSVTQIWCYGNSYKTMVVAVVVINPTVLYDFAISRGFWKADSLPAPRPGSLTPEFIEAYRALIEGPQAAEVKSWLASTLKAQEGPLQGYEKIKAFHIEPVIDTLGQGFTEENDCLTPTMKKKRVVLLERYLPVLKELYTSLNEPPREGERW